MALAKTGLYEIKCGHVRNRWIAAIYRCNNSSNRPHSDVGSRIDTGNCLLYNEASRKDAAPANNLAYKAISFPSFFKNETEQIYEI